ncbi:energy-coupling factor transporter transmembrane component T family protein [Desulfoluna spongiiphila]|uniref:Energy-coupling factor transport system permease protein n=1 Tax=Desulfoluna spongiiphila TaxID=419481 RepID=A0A1G5C706_9BACT|nr:energy-coupling factor transporter transmembrane component T [Desulfoluna spongiiphila]SCX98107.1 energy-coupling factor transport system permease protein [Desulfoluna spongiiphila]
MTPPLLTWSPWTRLCLLAGMVPVTFLLFDPPLSLLPLIVVVPLGTTSGAAVTWVGRTLALLIPFGALLALMYLVAMPVSGEVLWAYGPVEVGRDNAFLALSIFSRVGVMLGSLCLFAVSTPASELLTDLRRRGASPFLVYVLATTVNLVPLLKHRASCVLDAQRARGLDLDGGPMARARHLVPLVGPLLLGALADVEKRAMALELRGGLKRRRAEDVYEPPGEALLRLASAALVVGALGYRVWMLFR